MARNTNGTGFSLKDELFNKQKVQFLAAQFQSADEKFDAAGFIRTVMRVLLKLELKARITHIATVLEQYLDPDFTVAAKQIVAALPPKLDPTHTDDDFGDFILAPLGEYVVRNGCTKKDLKQALKTLKEITQRFSMEDAIRYFINAFPEETLAELEVWSTDKNYHVRRLVSEGTRPRLPWSSRLSVSYQTMVPFLDTLYADPTRYVTRSVANHLNDIAKDDPVLVVETLTRWKRQGRQNPDEFKWLTTHALRTLIKQGDVAALAFLGFTATPPINVSSISCSSKTVEVGDALHFSVTITAQKATNILVDYCINFKKQNGTSTPKVFKIKTLELAAGESIVLKKRHPFRKNATTFTFYSGVHTVAIQINGTQYAATTFELKV